MKDTWVIDYRPPTPPHPLAKLKSATVSHISGLAMKLKDLVKSENVAYFLLDLWLILLSPRSVIFKLM